MIDKPRIGYAALNEPAKLHAPLRYLPIIVVPGVAGTRLTDPITGKLAWNPLGTPLGKSAGAFTADYDRLSQLTADLVPDETHQYDEGTDEYVAAQRIKHYYHIFPAVNGAFATQLSQLDLPSSQSLLVKPKVYCCGYDWRQDNAKSAARLAAVVEEALAETRERRVIIVAHSMGCLVSRYYCRVLGGESKIHRLYLLGSPTQGAPSAYMILKNGIPGLYAKDIYEDVKHGKKGAAIAEGIQQANTVEQGVLGMIQNPGQSLMDKGTAFTGDLFIALSLGAGRLLDRDETKTLARHIPGLYQNIPGALYCRDNKNWLMFDPAATGHPPTGFMIVLPTLFSLLADVLPSGFKSLFEPDEEERTAPEATRNMQTLAQRMAAIGQAFAGKTDYTPTGQQTETGASKIIDNEKHALLMLVEVFQRIMQSFVDCSNARQVYSDIYTGFLDEVELRALCATNLELALRFDQSLTVNPSPVKSTTPLEFLGRTVLLPFLSAMPLTGPLGQLATNKLAASDAAAALKAAAKPALIYMPPRTTNVFCGQIPVDVGAVLIPTDVLSNNDSNLVQWMILPLSMVMPIIMAAGGAAAASYATQALGDNTVPVASSNPPAEKLSNDFHSRHEVMEKVAHRDLASHDAIYTWLSKDIKDLIPDFLTT